MKQSEIVKKALLEYNRYSFLCNIVQHFETKSGMKLPDLNKDLNKSLEDVLKGKYTLSGLLRDTNKKYAGYEKRYGWTSNACYKMRLEFWQAFIVELEAKGL